MISIAEIKTATKDVDLCVKTKKGEIKIKHVVMYAMPVYNPDFKAIFRLKLFTAR